MLLDAAVQEGGVPWFQKERVSRSPARELIDGEPCNPVGGFTFEYSADANNASPREEGGITPLICVVFTRERLALDPVDVWLARGGERGHDVIYCPIVVSAGLYRGCCPK